MAVLGVLAAVIVALLTAVLFVFVAYTVYLVIVHRRYAHIPQPKGASFYKGHISVLKAGFNHGQYLEWSRETGPIYVFWVLYSPTIMIMDPEAIKALCSCDVSKDRNVMESLFGQRLIKRSILTIPHYDDWKIRRRTFDPAFARSHLNSLVPVLNKVAREHLIDNLRSRADGETVVDMLKEFGNAALQVISMVAFGTDFTQDQHIQSISGGDDLLYLISHSFEGVMKVLMNPLSKYMKFGKNLSYAETALKLRQIGEYCIRKRLTALENNKEVPHDILTLILQTVQKESSIDFEELVDEFITFYFAGQETTSNLLSFSIVMLQQHPDVLHRVMEEIEEVVGDKTTVEADDLGKLTYMNQMFQESLRMYPPASGVAKRAHKGMKLAGYSIPEGTRLLVSVYGTHRQPEYYDDPCQFNPSRFDPDQKRPTPYMYLPFGIGHRMCIGKHFAMMEAKVLMVHLLRTYHVTLAQDYKLEIGQAVTIHPKGGVPCTLVARDEK